MEPTIFSFPDTDRCPGAIGAIVYRQGGERHSPLPNDYDLLIIAVCHDLEDDIRVEHFINRDVRYQLLQVGKSYLLHSLVSGDNPDILRCFLQGNVIWDVEGELTAFRGELIQFKGDLRSRRRFKEYSRMLRMYTEAKHYEQAKDFMDAYYCVMQALKHYANIELIEQGVLPESVTWEQMLSLNPVVYKLFHELTNSKETLSQRIDLLLLTNEFSIVSKMEDCCTPLLRVMECRKDTWSVHELSQFPELKHAKEDLPLVLSKLVHHSLIKEVTLAAANGYGEGREIRYKA
ncbi:nucleotidyltransferase-like protein [Paenibacillus motobuensis]|uniref:Nucleotidyltransferase-like domain-containing protein n=1 Tax=Paenibacillus motobuensis TaxID=295324 RepID=A0ABN0YTV1_9BACL